jgi:class 3 adenylate cyclase
MKKCILFTDIKSSSKLWHKHPKQMFHALTKHEKIIKSIADKFNGFILKTIGDAIMIEFPTLLEGVNFAIAVQKKLSKHPIKFNNSNDILQIRIGIAYGNVYAKYTSIQGYKIKDLFGTTVNLASRMESKVSKVGGFGLLVNGISKEVLDIIKKYCSIQQVYFKFNCDEKIVRSKRLLLPSICYDVTLLHIGDGIEHIAYSCELLQL